ncbi:MAG: hypothetical protein ACI4TK_15860 [Agathobacter sp.]
MEERIMMEDNIEKADVWKALGTVTYSAQIAEGAGRSDRMFYQHLQEGIETHDLDKIYEFIEANERGCGIVHNEMIRKLLEKAYAEDPHRLCTYLADRNQLIDYWIFLSAGCTTEMLVHFSGMDVPQGLFYYECARILMNRIRQEPKCEEGILSATKKLASLHPQLWERWLRRQEHNMHWQTLVFRVLASADCEALEIYANAITLTLSNTQNELAVITQAFQTIPDSSKSYILEHISAILWQRWHLLIHQKKKTYDFLNEICITAYTNLLLNAMPYILQDREEWKSSFLTSAKQFEQDMYAWFQSQVNRNSIFFYDLTQIYYLLIVGYRCQFVQFEDDAEIHQCLQKIKILIHRYASAWSENDTQKSMLEEML